MNILRTRLRWIVTLWLICHGGSLAAAPFALCCDDDMVTGVVEAPDADATLAHAAGDECPLHRGSAGTTPAVGLASDRADDRDLCVMRSTCRPSDIALASLLGSAAVLPSAATVAPTSRTTAVVFESPTPRTHADLPDAPPPRLNGR